MNYVISKQFHKWTYSAIQCYSRGCKCPGCEYTEIIETPCAMKATVKFLVKKVGAPTQEDYAKVGLEYNDAITHQIK